MNKKHAVKFLTFVQKIILSTAFILLVGNSSVQAEQSIVNNPMLSTSPVRYGPYTHPTNGSVQVQSALPATASSTKVKSSGSSKKDTSGIVNINSASETELVALPGIGPSKARAIAEYRQQHGRFQFVDDLKQVKGIGAATLEKLRTHVTL